MDIPKAVQADVEQPFAGFLAVLDEATENEPTPETHMPPTTHEATDHFRFPVPAVSTVPTILREPNGTKSPRPFCRICWERRTTSKKSPEQQPDPFVSPCLCTGTQRWVHLSCLKSWQQSVLDNAATLGDERAYRCGVCKSLYSISPASVRATGCRMACLRVFRLTLVIACLFALYSSIDSPYMWPLIGFVGLVTPLAGSREGGARAYQALLCLSLLLFIVMLRLFAPAIMTIEWSNDESPSASPVASAAANRASMYAVDLRPGSILLANDASIGHSSTFSNSVVLLFSHSATNGSQGVILNQRILSRAETLESGCFDPASDLISECIRHHSQASHDEDYGVTHYFGGPKFALERLVVLHTFSDIAGSREISLPGDEASIFVGGLMSDVLAESFLKRQSGDEDAPVWVFHGISSWSSGQLVDEIDAGAWTVKPGSMDDLVFFGMFE